MPTPYSMPTPAESSIKIVAPLTDSLTITPPVGYTIEGAATASLQAGAYVVLTLTGTNYLVTEGDFTVNNTIPATNVSYDNTTSGLTATNVQAAIDEVQAEIGAIDYPVDSVFGRTGAVAAQSGDYTATQVSFTTYGTLTATNVQTAIQQVEDMMNPVKFWYYWNDWEGSGNTAALITSGRELATISSGTLAPISGESGHVGIYALGTGVSTTGNSSLGTSAAIVLGAGETYIEHIIRIPILPTVAEDFTLRIGLGLLPNADGTDAVFFKLSNAVNSGQWQLLAISASTPQTVNTVITPVANTWYRLGIVINAGNTLATFYINGSSVGSINTGLPTAAMSVIAAIRKTAGSTARALHLDSTMGYIKFTTPR